MFTAARLTSLRQPCYSLSTGIRLGTGLPYLPMPWTPLLASMGVLRLGIDIDTSCFAHYRWVEIGLVGHCSPAEKMWSLDIPSQERIRLATRER